MNLVREPLDPLAQLLRDLREPGVQLQKLEQLRRLLRRELLSLEARLGQRFPVLRVGVDESLVAVGLPGLGEQNQRRRVGRLQAERERFNRMNG